MVTRIGRISLVHFLSDFALVLIIGFSCFYEILGQTSFRSEFHFLVAWQLFAASVFFGVFTVMHVYEMLWRYISLHDVTKMIKAITISNLICFSLSAYAFRSHNIPLLFFPFYMVRLLSALCGIRVIRRIVYERHSTEEKGRLGRRTLIYGAGRNGLTLSSRFKSDSNLKVCLVGFIDDDKRKGGMFINGFEVFGNYRELPRILAQESIEELVISIGNLSGKILGEVVQAARAKNVSIRLISNPVSVEKSKSRFEILRDISLDDLLVRAKNPLQFDDAQHFLSGKRILVTGAGGSIGSELSRQIAACRPEKLLLLDNSEFNLYSIDNELRTNSQDQSNVVPLLVDLKDQETLSVLMRKYKPHIVFHAAAYKHVHLVEFNPSSSILNNVGGTRNLLRLCQEIGVENFVLISTDKAVNPGGVMGATKRVCELMVTEAARETGRNYCAVRFGNVVGSSGSLIPMLERQIRGGGPVTITDENMTRYFMLIKEAVALVLHAGSLAKTGDIFILRMGEPIRILDIIKNLLTLMGRTEIEVPIVTIGQRPGEKLFEELYYSGQEVDSGHPDILVLPDKGKSLFPDADLGGNCESIVEELLRLSGNCQEQDVVSLLMRVTKRPTDPRVDMRPSHVVPTQEMPENFIAPNVV